MLDHPGRTVRRLSIGVIVGPKQAALGTIPSLQRELKHLRRSVSHRDTGAAAQAWEEPGMQERFEGAQTLSEFMAGAEQNQDMWRSIHARASIGEEILEAARQLPAKRHLLVLLEDWCGDAFNSVPWLARLADAVPDRLELRVLRRDENLDLMDAHLSPTGGRAIPVVMVLDEDYEEIGWWGSRPAPLTKWFEETGRDLEKDERYRQIRLWYARDRGVSTLTEVLALAGALADAPLAPAAGAD